MSGVDAHSIVALVIDLKPLRDVAAPFLKRDSVRAVRARLAINPQIDARVSVLSAALS